MDRPPVSDEGPPFLCFGQPRKQERGRKRLPGDCVIPGQKVAWFKSVQETRAP
jgi:hypothetical protein